MKNIWLLFCFLGFLQISNAQQDTLKINLHQADSIFLKGNYVLIAANYQVDVQKALVKQAKLWDNINLYTELDLYNATKKKAFDVGSTGEKIFTLNQVFKIAGQRNKQVQMAKEQVTLSEYQFYDLMRTLKFSLRQKFYTIYFDYKTLGKINRQLAILDTIITAYQTQYVKGNIPLKEVVRLKAVFYGLNNDKTTLLNEIFSNQSDLSVLLGSSSVIVPNMDDTDEAAYQISKIATLNLDAEAIASRYDLKMAQENSTMAQNNLMLQKRLAVPDLHLGATYDQAGSYINNYVGLTTSIDLPLWNQNNGNIKAAKIQIKQSESVLENTQLLVSSQVQAAKNKLLQAESEYSKVDTSYRTQFEELNKGITENFTKRNISLIEFTDLIEAYNVSVQQLNQLQITRLLAYEELNYSVGKELFK